MMLLEFVALPQTLTFVTEVPILWAQYALLTILLQYCIRYSCSSVLPRSLLTSASNCSELQFRGLVRFISSATLPVPSTAKDPFCYKLVEQRLQSGYAGGNDYRIAFNAGPDGNVGCIIWMQGQHLYVVLHRNFTHR